MEKVSIHGNVVVEVIDFGPDPVLLRKSGKSQKQKKKSETYRKRIEDPKYMDYAINKIAVELLHFIQK